MYKYNIIKQFDLYSFICLIFFKELRTEKNMQGGGRYYNHVLITIAVMTYIYIYSLFTQHFVYT